MVSHSGCLAVRRWVAPLVHHHRTYDPGPLHPLRFGGAVCAVFGGSSVRYGEPWWDALRPSGCSYGGVSSHYPMGLSLLCRGRTVPLVVESFDPMGETLSEQSYEGSGKGRHKGIRGNTARGVL